MYLWLNYAMFESMVNDDHETVGDVFRNALVQVKNTEEKKRLWMEYAI